MFLAGGVLMLSVHKELIKCKVEMSDNMECLGLFPNCNRKGTVSETVLAHPRTKITQVPPGSIPFKKQGEGKSAKKIKFQGEAALRKLNSRGGINFIPRWSVQFLVSEPDMSGNKEDVGPLVFPWTCCESLPYISYDRGSEGGPATGGPREVLSTEGPREALPQEVRGRHCHRRSEGGNMYGVMVENKGPQWNPMGSCPPVAVKLLSPYCFYGCNHRFH